MSSDPNLYTEDDISTHKLYIEYDSSIVSSSGSSSSSLYSSSIDQQSQNYSHLDSNVNSSTDIGTNTNTSTNNPIPPSTMLDRYGFVLLDPNIRNKNISKCANKEASRALKWANMIHRLEGISIKNWPTSHPKFISRLFKGIPESVRGKVWNDFIDPPPLPYKELYMKISGFERQVDLDIERTLRDHILFRTRFSQKQVSLFKVLIAYSNYDPEVGYCQGMSTVAAFLLLYFDEQEAFNIFTKMMQRDNLRCLYQTGFKMLFETFHVQEQLMIRLVPNLYRKLNSYNITTSIYATKWYLTIYLGFPFPLACRFWDLFLYYGLEILIAIAISLLKYHQSKILSLEYEACMQYISKISDAPYEEEKLLKLTRKIWEKIDHSIYQSLRNQYRQKYPNSPNTNYNNINTNSSNHSSPNTNNSNNIKNNSKN